MAFRMYLGITGETTKRNLTTFGIGGLRI